MIAWASLFGLAILVFLALWRIGGVRGAALQLVGAALLLGVAGYALQGTPSEPGDPHPPVRDVVQSDSEFAKERGQFLSRFTSGSQWLDFADALHRMGRDREAVIAIPSGLAQSPRDPDLWVGLGNALVIHGGGLVSPAAKLAFERARAISPENPGPSFFMGLAYAQGGEPAKAVALWRAMLAKAPKDAPWRADVEQRLVMLQAEMGGAQ